jgi:hypothetical protein
MTDDPESQPSPDEHILDVDIDLDEEELPAVPPAAGKTDLLVIESDQLREVSLPAPPAKPAPFDRGAPVGAPVGGPAETAPGPVIRAMGPPDVMGVISMLMAGAIGGFLAWLLVEPFITDLAPGQAPPTQLLIRVLGAMGLFAAALGGMIGMALGAVDGVNSRSLEKACWGALLGLGIGGAGGFFGGVIGQAVYGGLGGGEQTMPGGAQILVRGLAWALVGLCVGLGQGAWTRARRKMINGMIGGFLGGLIGGLLFDPLHSVVAFAARLTGGTVGGEVSRLVAIVVLGAACGAAIGLVEQARKEAWLRIVEGPLTGKQFIIYRSPTTIGSSPKCDITLARDKAVAPQHLSISQIGGRYVVADLGSPSGTRVNGQPVRSRTLRSGDRIGVGQTTMLYAERAVRGEG